MENALLFSQTDDLARGLGILFEEVGESRTIEENGLAVLNFADSRGDTPVWMGGVAVSSSGVVYYPDADECGGPYEDVMEG